MLLLDRPDLPINDDAFRSILKEPRFEKERHLLEELWTKYEPCADDQFVIEIRNQFHQRYWEMYLACSLMEQGHHLVPKRVKKGPDICIRENKVKVWIEAIAPNAGTGPDTIQMKKLEPGVPECSIVQDEKIILRYCSAIKEKHEKYHAYLSDKTIISDEPFLIAINGRRVPLSYLDDEVPNIIKAVLPFGNHEVLIDENSTKIINERYGFRGEIEKINKVKVSTQYFFDPCSSGISGILFSNSDVLNHPQIIGADLIFIHNPMAINSIKRGWLQIGREYWVENGELKNRVWN